LKQRLQDLTEKLQTTEAELEKASDSNVDLKKKARNDKTSMDQKVKKLEERATEQDRAARQAIKEKESALTELNHTKTELGKLSIEFDTL